LKVVLDVAIWTAAGYLAFPLRTPGGWLHLGVSTLLYPLSTVPIALISVLAFGLHRQVWRRVTVEDLEKIVEAVSLGSAVLFAVGLAWYHRGSGFPRTVPLIQGMLALLGLTGVRVCTRLYAERRWRREAAAEGGGLRRVLLVGAGDAGTQLGREIRRRPDMGMVLVGYLDDNPSKAHLSIAGTRVLGSLEDLPTVTTEVEAQEILITMPSVSGSTTRRVVELARQAGVDCRILPGITQVLSGDAQLAGIRKVEVEDLLRRKPVELELPPESYVRGGTVLVTGAGGSIGSELVRQVARLDPRKILLYGHGENTLHDVQQELAEEMPGLDFRVVIGDVRDRVKIARTLERYRPDVVLHAAAHKHVPLMEGDPDEAILNNVAGTRNVAEAARLAGVTRFVNVSTDKAVRPASMLGITKSLAERVVRCVGAQAHPGQAFVSVRFGNVLGSRGSVVPLFQEQIRRGGPIRITHPEMTRYFMTIPEASRLVIQAGALGVNGAVYVLDMGAPVRIVDLATDMIHLARADDDGIRIEFTGLRPGEKLHEELFTADEELGTTAHRQILVAHHEPTADGDFSACVEQLITAAERRDWQEIARCVETLIPGYDLGDGLDPHPVRLLKTPTLPP